MTGSEAQRKLLLGNATLLAYCLRWQEFRVRRPLAPKIFWLYIPSGSGLYSRDCLPCACQAP